MCGRRGGERAARVCVQRGRRGRGRGRGGRGAAPARGRVRHVLARTPVPRARARALLATRLAAQYCAALRRINFTYVVHHIDEKDCQVQKVLKSRDDGHISPRAAKLVEKKKRLPTNMYVVWVIALEFVIFSENFKPERFLLMKLNDELAIFDFSLDKNVPGFSEDILAF